MRQQQLQRDGARLAHGVGVGAHHHAVLHAGVARSRQPVLAFDFHHAHAARADVVQVGEVAQRRDGDPGRARRLEDGRVVGRLYGVAVYDDLCGIAYHVATSWLHVAPKP